MAEWLTIVLVVVLTVLAEAQLRFIYKKIKKEDRREQGLPEEQGRDQEDQGRPKEEIISFQKVFSAYQN